MAHGRNRLRHAALGLVEHLRRLRQGQRVARREPAPVAPNWRGTLRTRLILCASAFAIWMTAVEARLVYLQVFERVQREIGRLWQLQRITVAQEHYCTAAVQSMMAQFYPTILNTPKHGRTVVAACVGEEAHEVGIRLVADLLELNGWTTCYLGANVPTDALVGETRRRKADLVALSTTMAYHLPRVQEAVHALRNAGEACKILVGGMPFNQDSTLWQKVGADGTADDGAGAVHQAERLARPPVKK